MKLFKQRLKFMLKDKSPKKSTFTIAKELFRLIIKDRTLPTHYIRMYMYRAESGDYKDYLTATEKSDITNSPRLHKLEYTSLLINKLASALYFEKCDLPVPKLVSYNVNKKYFYNKQWSILTNAEELYDFFERAMRQSNTNQLFLKRHGELGGKGCYLLKKEILKETLSKIAPILLNGSFIHQECVEQHEEINIIYPHSLNTIRFETYIDRNKRKHIRQCYMRFGMGGHYVDNSHSGGIFIPLNLENGQLTTKAYQKFVGMEGGGGFLYHPDTGIVFKDYKIPYFEEAVRLVFRCLDYLPDRYIGWDIAISKKGPVLIEGNGNPVLVQTPHGFKKTKLGKEILEEVYRNE